jgi:hypothetical protein
MKDFLKVNAEQTFNTAHAVSNDAAELREELSAIVREWDSIPNHTLPSQQVDDVIIRV